MKKTLAMALAVFAMAGASAPAYSATSISLTNLVGAEYDTAGVFISGDINFTGSVDDGGGLDSVLLELWDDYALKYSELFSVLVGDSATFSFETSYAGLVGTAAPGIGLYVVDGGDYAVALDPYYLPHYADPSQCETDCGPTGAVPEPSTWAMMLLGFGAIGGALRFGRRQRKLAVAHA